jgi:hypothetical protein
MHVTFLFSTVYLILNTPQILQSILRIIFPVPAVATALKEMGKYCGRSFGINSNSHSKLLEITLNLAYFSTL